jgi:hypothetical protein
VSRIDSTRNRRKCDSVTQRIATTREVSETGDIEREKEGLRIVGRIVNVASFPTFVTLPSNSQWFFFQKFFLSQEK